MTKAPKPGAVFGQDDTDWYDKPPMTYAPDGKERPPLTPDEMRQRLDPDWQKQHGLAPLPPFSGDVSDL